MPESTCVMLSTAAPEKVVQRRRAGRIPKSVLSLREFQLRRDHARHQRELIEEEMRSLQGLLDTFEQMTARARLQLAQLRSVKYGTAAGERVADYIWWKNLSVQEKQSLEKSGYVPPTWPL